MNTNLELMSKIANTNTISEEEEKLILYFARRLGFNDAVVTCGIIYPFGKGDAYSCNQFAKQIVDALKEAQWNEKDEK